MIRQLTHGGKIPTAVDLMDTGGARLDPNLDVTDGMKELAKRHTSAAPVVDSTGWLRGLLTEKDCLRILSNAAFDGPSAGTVGDFMSPARVTIDPGMDLFRVAEAFLATNFPMLPVVDDGRLVGLIRRHQLLQRILDFIRDTAAERRKAEEAPSAGSNRPLSIEQMQRVLADYQRGN